MGALLLPAAGRSDVDHQGLNPPTQLEVMDASTTSLTIAWKAGHGRPARDFALFMDGQGVASTTGTRYTFTDLSCGTSYTLGVQAIGSGGNRSDVSSVIAAPSPCTAPAPGPPTPSPPAAPPSASDPSEFPDQPPDEPSSPVPPGPAFPTAPEPETEPPFTLPDPGKPSAEMSWAGAGAFVWHETDVAPEALGSRLRESGFSWVAVLIHDGLTADPLEGDWVRRFHAASGLPVGGWGVLRTEPDREADLAHRLLDYYSLDFYIANPEAEYKFSNDDGTSDERFGRSRQFVERFRTLEPDMPAAISSYCRADTQDIDWRAWNESGFVFLPQAYVNDFGSAASPAACAEGAAGFFPMDSVHPTVGMYTGQRDGLSAEHYVALLDEAGTVGFSVYLAETRMYARDWHTFGKAIAQLEIAHRTAETPASDEVVGAHRAR